MRIGFGLPVSGAWARPDTVVDFAGRAEKLGYESLWTFQRLLADPNEMEVVNRSVLDTDVDTIFNTSLGPGVLVEALNGITVQRPAAFA